MVKVIPCWIRALWPELIAVSRQVT